MTLQKINISEPCVGEEEYAAVAEVIASGWLTQGPKVAAFEKAFAEQHGVPHAIAVSSCTTGLHLALLALGIGPGDEVIVPSFTWIASANAVLYVGATPVLCDVDPVTFNIDVVDALSRVTPRTKAVMAVHLFGLCADIDALRAGLPGGVSIIEDAACAAGAIYKGKAAGGLGDIGVFSFHPRKVITTGEGGMITTANKKLAESVSILRNHGATISEEQRHQGPRPHLLPEFVVLGFNYRMTDLQGAIGCVQLGRLMDFIKERAHWADFYRQELASLQWLHCPAELTGGRHAWQAYVAMVDAADSPIDSVSLMDELQTHGIATRPGTHAVHMQSLYRERLGTRDDDLPGAFAAAKGTIALPLHNKMKPECYHRVVEALLKIGRR